MDAFQGSNQLIHLALKMGAKTVIGDYSVMFQTRSEFLYQALTPTVDSLAMRKSNYQEIQDKYDEFTMKLKLKTFNRYKGIIREPVLQHKQETIDQIQLINKFDLGITASSQEANERDEEAMRKEMEKKSGEGQAQLKSIKRLEEKVEQLGLIVNNLFIRYDWQMLDMKKSGGGGPPSP